MRNSRPTSRAIRLASATRLARHPSELTLPTSALRESLDLGGSEVKLTTLDAATRGLDDIKLIKVDVEGHDYAALVGAKDTIGTHKPIILFEQLAEDAAAGESASIKLLKTYGYTTFAVIRRHPRAVAGLPTPLRAAFALFGRLLLGETMEIEVGDRSPEGYHAMVIAIPDWLKL
jgi:Methyltransferase FkbM domain